MSVRGVDMRGSIAERETVTLRHEYSRVRCRHNQKFPDEPFISFPQFRQLSKAPCYYCNEPPMRVLQDEATPLKIRINGLDRLDNEHGYSPDNVVPCCPICNDAKGTMTEKQFQNWINRLVKYHS